MGDFESIGEEVHHHDVYGLERLQLLSVHFHQFSIVMLGEVHSVELLGLY